MKVTHASHHTSTTDTYESNQWTYTVDSSAISYLSHHLMLWHSGVLAGQEHSDLSVGFTNGSLYVYEGVPTRVVLSLITAESVGKAFHSLIKKGGYEYKKVRDADPKPVKEEV